MRPSDIEEIEGRGFSMLAKIWLGFSAGFPRSCPHLLARVANPRQSLAARQAAYHELLSKHPCCRWGVGMADKLFNAYDSPAAITQSGPQALIRCFVRLAKPHILENEPRHWCQKFVELTRQGRGVGLTILSIRFATRDLRQHRSVLNQAVWAHGE